MSEAHIPGHTRLISPEGHDRRPERPGQSAARSSESSARRARAFGDVPRLSGRSVTPGSRARRRVDGATDSRAPTWIFPTQVGTWASGSIEDTEGWGSGLSVTLESELGMIATLETDWLEQRRATLAKKKAKDL